jgi:hypothetical protein
MKHRAAAIGLTVGLLAGGAAGVALGVPALSGAQETTTPSTEEADRPDRGQHLRDTLQPLVEDGTITQAQADAVITALQAARPEGRPGMGRDGRGPGLDAATTVLGMGEDELRAALQEGRSLAEIAQDRGIDPQVVIDAMVAGLQDHLAEEVASGERTQEEADARMAEATGRITAMVNGEMPAGGPRGMHGPPDGEPAA